MTPATLIVLALVIPTAVALLLPLFASRANLRETVTLIGAVLLLVVVLMLLPLVLAGERPALDVWMVVPGLTIAFKVEPLGMLFAIIASGLWIANSVYSIGYMRAEKAHRQTLFYFCFAVAIAATMGIALSGNLFTLFLFYELLTVSTYPLVTHRGTVEARNAGRLYLLMLLGASTILLLPALGWTWVAAETLDFRPGGILGGVVSNTALGVLLALYVFGTAKAAVMPLHFWLPAAMVAPTPVSALLHAVAVVKAGVFTILKVIVYTFGVETLAAAGTGDWLVYVAGVTVIVASAIALRQDNLKRRLAFSTISQLSYVVLGAALFTPLAVLGAALHIAAHAVSKITLFFAAGSIHIGAHVDDISRMKGVGRRQPWTMGAFAVASLSMIGVPPTAGFLGKWFILLAAVGIGQWFAVGVIVISTLLNAGYFLPIVYRAFSKVDGARPSLAEAPWPMVAPLVVTAILTVAMFVWPEIPYQLAEMLSESLTTAPAGG
ncbi:MAG: monovalent cation/H+ antiporter subunit D family protein [Bauldia sp.]|uniref:monovalent cation/H+ antiporter subunit D family protein n=1 Tax=Bauldia sp. TaxID=2575872 RepID=UPI001DD463AB|nr:monovalent cation/H+ antiporter subunit D family protein [Bauldia sp.]MCB1495187.1 monovalent cation/H+ antiporter subunit D family protein [Bauldia sp.]